MPKPLYPETFTVELVDKDNAHRMVSVLPTTENPNIHWIVVTGPNWESVWIKTKLENIKSSSDYKQELTFIDPWTIDERISTIVHSSISLWLSLTETFVWLWTSPNYYLSTITLS